MGDDQTTRALWHDFGEASTSSRACHMGAIYGRSGATRAMLVSCLRLCATRKPEVLNRSKLAQEVVHPHSLAAIFKRS
jgi:hypothetical protein